MIRSLIRPEADIACSHPSHRVKGSSINPITVPATAKDVRDLIAFYLDAGVDSAVAEEPINHFADRPEPIAQARETPAAAPRIDRGERPFNQMRPPAPALRAGNDTADIPRSAATTPVSPEAAVMAAREAARTAQNLDELRALLDNFEGCMLRATATQLVFAAGNPGSRVMFVGEAPGRDEDLAGEPFVGRSGKLLDLMLQAIGLDRTKAYIANVVPWRPPGNRTPTPHETAICLPFIRRQIELANPDILVCLGQPSTQTLLGTREGITRTRGRWFKFDTGTREIRATATYHPAFLLRSPLQKRLVWRDFLALKRALTG
jgi:uracil-DNA glycosylase